jgi:DNA-binding transcriptional regulator YbjK
MESQVVTRAQLAQGRSRQRRDELLAATIELFAEGGSRAVTHRAVARRAGLPPATTTYYFASIQELLREALAAHIKQWASDLADLTALDPGPTMSLDEATDLVSHVFKQRGPEVAALELSIYLAATRDPALRRSATEALEKFEALAVQILARLGVQKGEPLAASIIALIAGTALRRQSGQYTEQQEARQMTTAIRNLIAAHILGDDKVTKALKGA